jgi:hypothetical protein
VSLMVFARDSDSAICVVLTIAEKSQCEYKCEFSNLFIETTCTDRLAINDFFAIHNLEILYILPYRSSHYRVKMDRDFPEYYQIEEKDKNVCLILLMHTVQHG